MTRRFDESLLATPMAAPAASCVPGFVACSISAYPANIQQLWHAIYQTALSQAVKKAVVDNEPTKYQRLMHRVCLN